MIHRTATTSSPTSSLLSIGTCYYLLTSSPELFSSKPPHVHLHQQNSCETNANNQRSLPDGSRADVGCADNVSGACDWDTKATTSTGLTTVCQFCTFLSFRPITHLSFSNRSSFRLWEPPRVYFIPLFGAYMADPYLGRYSTVVGAVRRSYHHDRAHSSRHRALPQLCSCSLVGAHRYGHRKYVHASLTFADEH